VSVTDSRPERNDQPHDALVQAERAGASLLKQARRLIVLIVGLTVMLAGAAMLALPGP